MVREWDPSMAPDAEVAAVSDVFVEGAKPGDRRKRERR